MRDRRGDRRAEARALRALPGRARRRRRPTRRSRSSSSTRRARDAARASGSSAPIVATGSSARHRRPRSSRRLFASSASSAAPRSRSARRSSSGSRDSRRRLRSAAPRPRRARARCDVAQLGLDELLVLVVADPGHKIATTPAETRLELARLAFADVPEATVELDHHARTVDSLEERRPRTPSSSSARTSSPSFESWKSPERVLELVRLAVAMRPGVARDDVEAVRERLGAGDRIVEFEMEPVAISSSEIRARVARGEPVDDVVPAASRTRSRVSVSTRRPSRLRATSRKSCATPRIR